MTSTGCFPRWVTPALAPGRPSRMVSCGTRMKGSCPSAMVPVSVSYALCVLNPGRDGPSTPPRDERVDACNSGRVPSRARGNELCRRRRLDGSPRALGVPPPTPDLARFLLRVNSRPTVQKKIADDLATESRASAGQRGLGVKSAQLASCGLSSVPVPTCAPCPSRHLSRSYRHHYTHYRSDYTPLHPTPLPRSRHATPGIIAHRPRGYPGTFASYHSLCRLAANARLPNTAASIARFTRAPSFPATAHSPAYSKTSAA
jgi:hypothetical protein